MFDEALRKIKQQGLYRTIKDRQSSQGRIVRIDGRDLINFSSNDYLGLCANTDAISNEFGL
ncbi:hypothetical protein MCHI_000951 [Candidatus Magnetoovum chiemensis]|nr:hypothetical protein MCHI_000951 [Candidatus Magnetoovum chiemensis]